jgi:hypothetical protein
MYVPARFPDAFVYLAPHPEKHHTGRAEEAKGHGTTGLVRLVPITPLDNNIARRPDTDTAHLWLLPDRPSAVYTVFAQPDCPRYGTTSADERLCHRLGCKHPTSDTCQLDADFMADISVDPTPFSPNSLPTYPPLNSAEDTSVHAEYRNDVMAPAGTAYLRHTADLSYPSVASRIATTITRQSPANCVSK